MEKLYKQLDCLDVDPQGGCAFEVRASTEEEVMRLGADHAKHCHATETFPPDIAQRVKMAIKTVTVDV